MLWELTRRGLLEYILALTGGNLTSASWLTSYGQRGSSVGYAGTITVEEITIAATDIICVEVRDPPVIKGALVDIGSRDSGPQDTWVQRKNPTRGGIFDYCQIVGPNKDWLKFSDIRSNTYLNRSAALNAAGYGTIGGKTVTAVYHKSLAYDEGNACYGGAYQVNASSLKHFLFLKISGDLLQGGPYTISFPPGTGLLNTSFTFNDKITRALAIRASQVGHRPGDANKLAYLSLFIPGYGTEGQIDLPSTYSLNSFEIIDASGTPIFTGTMSGGQFALRVTPTATEAGDNNKLHVYMSTTVPPRVMTAITNASPGVFTCANHGFSNGDVIILSGIGQRSDGIPHPLNDFTGTISDATTDDFTLIDTLGYRFGVGSPVDTSRMPAYVPDVYLPGYDSLICATHRANRAATYVYGLDYSTLVSSNLRGSTAPYRVHVPGLGVSDPFPIDDTVWTNVAANSCAGYYHQLNGVAIDGRFGYSRPSCFIDGANGVEIYKSNLSMAFTNEDGGYGGGGLDEAIGGSSPWITATRATGLYGTFRDAGDWPSVLWFHSQAVYLLMDLTIEFAPSSVVATNFNFPRSTALLDPTIYAGTDSQPDAFHQTAYFVDFYRRTQQTTGTTVTGLGMVASGMSFSPAPGDGGSTLEPSFISRQRPYLHAADHASTFAYACVAAKFSTICSKAGLMSLASLYSNSATNAWSWAELIYQNAFGERDAYYNTTLNTQSNAGWTSQQYSSNIAVLQTQAHNARIGAAGAMFRLTGDSAFKAICESSGAGGLDVQDWAGIMQWEYYNSSGGNSRIKTDIARQFVNSVTNEVLTPGEGTNAYFTSGGAMSTGINLQAILWNYLISPNKAFRTRLLEILQSTEAVILGANQYGMCWTTGLGTRNTMACLNRDPQAQGLPPPKGYTTYTWWNQVGGGLLILNYSSDSPLNFTVELPTGTFESDFGTSRITYPHRLAVPMWEWVPENSYSIFSMEYTTQQVIIPQQIVGLWLSA